MTRTADGMTPHFVDIFDSSGEYTGSFDAPGVPVAVLSDSVFAGLRLESVRRDHRLSLPPAPCGCRCGADDRWRCFHQPADSDFVRIS